MDGGLESGGARRHDDVTGEREREAAAGRGAVDGDDHRHPAVAEALDGAEIAVHQQSH